MENGARAQIKGLCSPAVFLQKWAVMEVVEQ